MSQITAELGLEKEPSVPSSPTLAHQRIVANDGDAEALAVLLGNRNLVDLVSLQVGLEQTRAPSYVSVQTVSRLCNTEKTKPHSPSACSSARGRGQGFLGIRRTQVRSLEVAGEVELLTFGLGVPWQQALSRDSRIPAAP